ncbi:MAG: DNA translocase FtsK [Acidobacteria bacterium]|nr:MAG: DNA translocase FtsK [Acidobacteriota bacterium]
MAAGSTLSRRVSEFLGVAVFALALIWSIALVTYDPSDPAWFFNAGANGVPANFIGRVGAFLAELSFQLMGYGAVLIPALLGVVGWNLFWCRHLDAVYTKSIGATLLAGCVTSLLNLALGTVKLSGRTLKAGGFVGAFLSDHLAEYFNRAGSIIVILTLLLLAVILATQFSFGRLFSSILEAIRGGSTRAFGQLRDWREARRKEKARREVVRKRMAQSPEEVKAIVDRARPEKAAAKPQPPAIAAQVDAAAAGRGGDAAPEGPVERRAAPAISRPTPPPASGKRPVVPPPAEHESRTPIERKREGFTLPPLALLDAPKSEQKIDERELMEAARLLEEKCHEFAVAGSVVQIHPGPVVTTFEFKPDAGVKYAKVTGLADDLSLALKAESVLIERIPGKSTVGIQIPNTNREQISLREILESEVFRRSGSKLTLALGKNIHGEPCVADLANMPHLLIAGSTGTGKSVAINSMLTSILYRATPDDVRLIMIDPKRLELGMYEEIPHLLTPVVVEPKQAAHALNWAVHEMEERYKTLAAEGVRNIEQYNRNVRNVLEEKREHPDGEEDPRPLPYILVLIDELADLMMVASNEVEESICRLAQMARAVGIHLILATQRPSVDVITGLIKANLPARISFRVSSKVDSRTILDGNGAEQLLGRGDMLYLPPASSRLVRMHGPYISEQESARLAAFLRKQGKPVYDESVTAEDKGVDGVEFEKDDLYDEAARIVVGSGQASISYLQRRLRIGFSRAARLVDMMEAEGLVSPAAGSKPREVLVDKGYFDEVDTQLR